MELPDVAKVERLSLRPGDRLVLTADRPLGEDELYALRDRMQEWARGCGLPEGSILVLDAGMSLQVLEAGAVSA